MAKVGYLLWRQITNVVILTESRRQRGPFSEFLFRLRDAKCTEDDWKYLIKHCASRDKTQAEIESFHTPHVTWLFNTNADNNKHNTKMLANMGVPRVCMKAEHDCAASVSKSADSARRLSPYLYLCRGARIMILWNINSSIGLVNGATGTVKDWVYKEGQKAPALPEMLVVEMDVYSGPLFFTGEGREKWVPLLPQKHSWQKSQGGNDHYRLQYPICLAWGLTVWKSQGMTIMTKLGYDLGLTEPEAGLTYVALSRMTEIELLFINAGCSLARMTTTIQKNLKLKVRLEEDVRLIEEARKTSVFFFPIQL